MILVETLKQTRYSNFLKWTICLLNFKSTWYIFFQIRIEYVSYKHFETLYIVYKEFIKTPRIFDTQFKLDLLKIFQVSDQSDILSERPVFDIQTKYIVMPLEDNYPVMPFMDCVL